MHRAVLYEKLGADAQSCHWCQAEVRWRTVRDAGSYTGPGALLVDHLDGNKRNNDPANLVPSCHRCNVWRNPPQPLVPADSPVVFSGGVKYRAVERVCESCGKAFLARVSQVKIGKGRFCTMECAKRRP